MEESFPKKKGKTVKGSAGFLSAGEDMISELPDALISQILSYLPTKEAVRTSVLSNRWKSLWLLIPGLDLASSEFPNYNAFVSFMDRLLGFCREEKSCLHKLKIVIQNYVRDQHCVTRWIDFVATPKLKHLHVEFGLVKRMCMEVMPLSLYVCETLLHLRLDRVRLGSFKSVSLPRLKTMRLEENVYANESVLELLISSCPLLEDLNIVRRENDNVKVLRVHSQTLTSLSIEVGGWDDYDEVEGLVEDSDFENSVDAPRLKYLTFQNVGPPSKIISKSGSLTKVNIAGDFFCLCDDDEDEVDFHISVRNFFASISGVGDMKICFSAFNLIDEIMPSPQFCNLSCLEAELKVWSLGSVPKFLASCPNLRSIVFVLTCTNPRV